MQASNVLETLLDKIALIQKKYDEIDKITGRNFNIFEAGNIGHKELFHTKLIAELLHRYGTHNQNNIFLKLFLQELGIKEKLEKTYVYAEYAIENDRRIDIVIENESFIIGIEAKVYASDQDIQLQDYYDYLERKNKNFYLIYLTLDGHSPSEKSLGNLEQEKIKKIKIVSFKYEIINWLTHCIKEVYDKVNLRDSLLIYKDLLEKLTYTNTQKEKEMADILKNQEKIESAFNLFDAYEVAWAEKEYYFWTDLYNKIEKNIDSQWDDGDDIFSHDNDSVWYNKDGELLEKEESISRIKKIRYGSKNQSFGIAFKREFHGVTIYFAVACWNNSDSGWMGIEIYKNGECFSGAKIKEYLMYNKNALNLDETDEESVYKLIEEIKFPSSRDKSGNFDLFDSDKYKKILKQLADEASGKINTIDKILKIRHKAVDN